MTGKRKMKRRSISLILVMALTVITVAYSFCVRRQDRLDSLLMAAIQKEDSKAVEGALNAGAYVNAIDRGDWNPYSSLDSFRWWFQHPHQHGDPALILTIGHKRPDLIRLLLDRGADINMRGNCLDTALIRAASMPDVPALQVLIARRAELNARQEDGRTALNLAIGWHNAEAVTLLRQAGAKE